jgi:protein SCO1
MSANSRLALIIGAIVVGIFTLFVYQFMSRSNLPTPINEDKLQSSLIYPEPKELKVPPLLTHKNEPFDHDALKGKWTFTFFGYTHCPDICPTTLAVFKRFYSQLPVGFRKDTNIVFMTVDPERDTQPKLAEYMPFFDKDFIGVTGDVNSIDFFARQLGAVFVKSKDENNPENYLMDHTAKIFLTNKLGQRFAIFSPEHTASGHVYNPEFILNDYMEIRRANP